MREVKMIKTGIYEWFGYQIDYKERFKLIREAGFDYVLLWWVDEYADSVGNKNFLPELARSVGLEVENIQAPFDKTNLIWKESINSEDIVKRYVQ